MTRLCQCHFCHFILAAIQTSFISNHNYHGFCWLSLKNNGTWNNLEVHTNVPLYTPMSQLALLKWTSLQKSYHSWHVMISTQITSPSCHWRFLRSKNSTYKRCNMIAGNAPAILSAMILFPCNFWSWNSDSCQSWFFRIWNPSVLSQKTYSPQWCFFPRQKVNHHWGNILETSSKDILISSKQSNQYLSTIGGKQVLPSKQT